MNPRNKNLILVAIVVSALGAAARDARGNSTSKASATLAGLTKAGGKYPKHLATLAGVFIVGTIALIAEELSTNAGLPFAFLLVFDIGLSLFPPAPAGGGGGQVHQISTAAGGASILDTLSASVLGGGTPIVAPVAGVIPTQGAVFI